MTLEDIRRRDARDWPVISVMTTAGRNYESRVTIKALQRVATDRHDLLAEVTRLESLVMVYRPVYEAVRDTPGNAAMAVALIGARK